MNHRVHPRVLTAAGLALALTLSACAGTAATTAPTTAPTTTAGSTAAGEITTSSTTDSATVGSSTAMTDDTSASTNTAASDDHNDADVAFVQQMIPHHQSAIEMADLAPDRAGSQAVKDLAAQIKAAQQPEIELMNSWLDSWDAAMSSGMDGGMEGDGMTTSTSTASSASSMSGMDMGGMDSGMDMGGMSAGDMAALAAATGAEFDRLFLEQMIVHHQGAVAMADTEISVGSNPDALALAESIRSGQTAEIATMQQLLAAG